MVFAHIIDILRTFSSTDVGGTSFSFVLQNVGIAQCIELAAMGVILALQ
jgi:hypothetical protein